MNELTTKLESLIAAHLTAYDNALVEAQKIRELFNKARIHGQQAGDDFFCREYKFDSPLNEECKNLKSRCWESLIKSTQLVSLMDSKTKDKMRKDIDNGKMPELTKENVFNILTDLFNRRDEILANSLLNTFYHLSPDYRSNDKFKLTDKRIIIEMGGFYHSNKDYITDLDRFFHFIDGKEFSSKNYQETLGNRVAHLQNHELTTVYFRIKKFRNRNAHIYFLRKDLIDQCNRLIAYYNKNKLGKAA